jgi:hypothetical protein
MPRRRLDRLVVALFEKAIDAEILGEETHHNREVALEEGAVPDFAVKSFLQVVDRFEEADVKGFAAH